MEKLKKFAPFIFLGVGILLLVFVFLMRGRGAAPGMVEDDGPELPFSQRPFTSLTPTADGYYLNLVIDRINVPGVSTLDYELYYETAEGISQGVTGMARLANGITSYENSLLLGSESAGNFRYDEGVSQGTLTLRFRDSDGKTIGRISGQWHLLSGEEELTSLDGVFTYTLDSTDTGYFVVMPTFGLPDDADFELVAGPYGVFSSGDGPFPGTVSLPGSVYAWADGTWAMLAGNSSEDIGVFASSN